MELAVQQLRKKGYRLTKQRKHILDTMPSRPFSVTEAVAFLALRNVTIDKVTVYRSLDFFVNLGIASKTQFKDNVSKYELLREREHHHHVSKTQFKDNVSKYELLREREHHHHVVCDGCGSIEDVPFDEDSMLRYIQKQTKFEIKSHLLEFFGLCTRCQRA